jgi:hypothetical protein
VFSATRILVIDVCLHVLCVVLLCVVRDIMMAQSPVQGFQPVIVEFYRFLLILILSRLENVIRIRNNKNKNYYIALSINYTFSFSPIPFYTV